MRRLLFALVLGACASSVGAEVRVVSRGGALTLDVRPTAEGYWTPLRHAGPGHVINGNGDAHGDSHPAHVRVRESLVIAWTRPVGEVHVAEVDGGGVVWNRALEAPGAIGSPLVVAMGGVEVVAWTSHGPEESVYVAYHLGDGQVTPPVRIDVGSLAGLVQHGDSALLAVRDSGSAALRVWRWTLPEPLPNPPRLIAVESLSAVSSRGASSVTLTAVPCLASTPDSTLIEWRTGPGTVKQLLITGGVASVAVERQGGNPCSGAGLTNR